MTPPCRLAVIAITKNHHPVGAGHAPPATKRQQQYYRYSVGAAYMPPAAAIPANQPNGETPRDASMRPLQTCRKFAFPQLLLTFRQFVGRGLDPSLPSCGYCNNQKPPPGRGGACPARDKTATTILRVLRRGGIYAARAAIPKMRCIGQTAQASNARPYNQTGGHNKNVCCPY